MGKKDKTKMRWVSNSSSSNVTDEALYSDKALEELVAMEFPGETMTRRDSKEEKKPERKVNFNGNNGRFACTERDTSFDQNAVIPESYKQTAVKIELPKIKDIMDTTGLTEDDIISIIKTDMKHADDPVYTEPKEGFVTGLIESKRSVSIENIQGTENIVITDKYGNRLSIPVAIESDPTYSLRFMLDKFYDNINDGSKDVEVEEYISYTLSDLAAVLARGQILWGKPDFIIESKDLDDLLSDLHVKEFCAINLLLTKSNENPGYIFGFITEDMQELVQKWSQIIEKYYTTKEDYEKFDEFLITIAALYRVLVDQRYICYGELNSSFTDYLTDNSVYSVETDRIVNAFTNIAAPIEEYPELTIQINDSVEDVANGMFDLVQEGSNDTLSLFCRPEEDYNETDSWNSEESGEGYEETGAEEDGYSGAVGSFDPEEMARQFAEDYQRTHPDARPSGYVQNAESVGAPVGEKPFHGEGTENLGTADSGETSTDPADDVYGRSENGSVGTGTSENTENSDESDSKSNGRTETGHRSWDANVSDYTSKEVKEETSEETGNRSGNHDGVKVIQKEAQKVESSEDALIIPVVTG